ncbi:hypothetical protein NKDENANG_01705 [Candidatus Entotheonellaceae bacterium PAL068K]
MPRQRTRLPRQRGAAGLICAFAGHHSRRVVCRLVRVRSAQVSDHAALLVREWRLKCTFEMPILT